MGIRTLAVVFMHAYAYPEHEVRVGALAREMGFDHVSLSSEVMPMAKVGRGFECAVLVALGSVWLSSA
jgi:5-oxoprolinase (ATP-hydrolysing)